ncbi:MAG: hypothetical protein JO362_20750 [Streptomycetaceae bacterium]|nr:hypothetical protein [Streptomycetaceae bacterium]
MTDVKNEAQSDMPDVVSLVPKADTGLQARAAKAPVGERNEKASLTPVFDAIVRDWRAKGRDIPLRHKPAVPVQKRDAA